MLFTSMKQFILTTITKPPEVMVNKIIRNTNGTSKKLLSQFALLLGFLGSLITFHSESSVFVCQKTLGCIHVEEFSTRGGVKKDS